MERSDQYLELTLVDREILNSYKFMIANLGTYLGEGYEIILHSLEDLQHSVIQIVNGHYSGRKVGAPITDFALSMLKKIEQKKDHSAVTYLNKSKTGVTLRSVTIPILGEKERIIGLLCMNFYTNVSIASLLEKFALSMPAQPVPQPEVAETFAENADDLITASLETVRDKVLNDNSISTQNKNKEIVIALYNKGIFNLKDSVVKVADLLKISKNTVYMHIRSIKA